MILIGGEPIEYWWHDTDRRRTDWVLVTWYW